MRPSPPTTTDSKPPRHLHLWEIVALRDLLIIGIVGGMLWVGYHLQAILVPVLIALGLAYLTNPVLDYVEHGWKLPRWAVVTVMVLLFCLVVTGLGVWVGPILTDQLRLLIEKAPTYFSILADRHGIELSSFTQGLKEFSETVQQQPFSALKTLLTGTGQVLYMTNLILGTLGTFLFSVSLIVIYFFFFAWGFPAIQRSWDHLVQATGISRLPQLLAKMDRAVGDFFRGRLFIALIMSVMFGVGWFWAGVPYWVLLGLGAGLLSLVPYAATLIWPIAILLKYLDMSTGSGTDGNYWMQLLLWPSIVYMVVQVVEGWILTPWIQSQSTDLSAATILLVVLIGGAVGGVLGLILAIPFTVCLKILAQELILPWSKGWVHSMDDSLKTEQSDSTIHKP